MALTATDVEFGRAVLNSATGTYEFQASSQLPDAVRVGVRLTSDSPNGALSLTFARIFGNEEANISAEAVAMMVPRDIAIVVDLSGSHNDDSELRHYRTTDINIHEVWDAFPGGIDDAGGTNWDG